MKVEHFQLLMLAIGLANLLGVIPMVRYALRSEIRDQILAHELDMQAHGEARAEIRRLRKWAHGVDNTMTSIILAHETGSKEIDLHHERLGADD